MKNYLLNNIGLKILSLFLAIMVWIYISGEVDQEKEESLRQSKKGRVVRER